MSRFEGRTAVVTGAASGIGLALTSLLRAEGATVVGADLHCADVDCDVSSDADVERVVRRALDETGRLDVLCNNAGIGSTTDPVSCSRRRVGPSVRRQRPRRLPRHESRPAAHARRRPRRDREHRVGGRTRGLARPGRLLREQGRGRRVHETGRDPVRRHGRALQLRLPGTVDSPWVNRLLDEADDPAEARRALVARQPIGRLGRPEEIAGAIAYLASDEAAFVTARPG